MRLDVAREIFGWLRNADEEEIRRIVWAMTPDDVLALDSMFELWAHGSQLPPPGEWRVWLLMAGRGSARRGPAPSGSTRLR